MTQLGALIFDVDGTLAETECHGHRIAFNRAFQAYDLPWEWSEELYGSLLSIGGGKERIRHFIHQLSSEDTELIPDSEVPQLHQLKNQFYEEILLKGEIPLRPGVRRLIHQAQDQGIQLAIATTSSLSNTLALLKFHLGEEATSLFSVIGAGDVVPQKKPAPDIYHYVLEKLECPSSSCLVFEDSAAGVKSAHSAQLKTIMTLNAYTENHSQEGAALVVNHLGETDYPCDAIAGSSAHQLENFQGVVTLDLCQQILNHP